MASNYAGLLLSIVIILLAFEYSSANVHEANEAKGKWPSKTGEDVFLHNEAFDANGRRLGGRKMLQRVEGGQSNVPGKYESSAPTEPQKDSDDTKAWFEAAEEVASLMHKDYKGTDRAKRRSPIHNHVPNN